MRRRAFALSSVLSSAGAAFAVAASLGVLGAAGAVAQPASKTVRVIVPFAPGGPADVLGRVVGEALSDGGASNAIVENKAGAAGNLGTDAIAKAAPDGTTMGIVPVGNIAVNPSLYPTLPYKAAELAPVTMLATVENVLVVGAAVPATNLKELLALAAARPGTLSFASPGAGSQAHLAGELMQVDAGVQLIHVPYKGTGPALNDLLGGQVTMMFAQLSSALPQIKAGKLKAIGLASPKRNALLPEVPTIAEQGLARFEAVSWYALMVPSGTPRETIERLNADTNRWLARPATKDKLAALGLEVGGGTPDALARSIQAETARWSDVVKKRSLKPE